MSTASTTPHTPRERAIAFLKEHLGDGRQLPQRTVIKMAKKQGISVRTLYRAKLGLVRSVHVGFGKGSEWVWVLKDQGANLSKATDESLATFGNKVNQVCQDAVLTVQGGGVVATFGQVHQEHKQDQDAVLAVVPMPEPAPLPVEEGERGAGGIGDGVNLFSLVKQQEEGVDIPVSTTLLNISYLTDIDNYLIDIDRVDREFQIGVDRGDRSALSANSLPKDREQVDASLDSPVYLFSIDNNYSLDNRYFTVDMSRVDREDISSPSCQSLLQDIGEEGISLLLTPPFQPVLLLLLFLAGDVVEVKSAAPARLAARFPAGGKLPRCAALPYHHQALPVCGPIGLARGPSIRLLDTTHTL